MLSYAYGELRRSVYRDLEEESFDNIYSLFAAILSQGISYQLKQGLYREYEEKRKGRTWNLFGDGYTCPGPWETGCTVGGL